MESFIFAYDWFSNLDAFQKYLFIGSCAALIWIFGNIVCFNIQPDIYGSSPHNELEYHIMMITFIGGFIFIFWGPIIILSLGYFLFAFAMSSDFRRKTKENLNSLGALFR